MRKFIVSILFVIFVTVFCLHGERGNLFLTINEDEFKKVVECVAKTANPKTISKYEACISKMADQTVAAFTKCKDERVPPETNKSNFYSLGFDKLDILKMIYHCTEKSVSNYTQEDKSKMAKSESCLRKLYVDTCGNLPTE